VANTQTKSTNSGCVSSYSLLLQCYWTLHVKYLELVIILHHDFILHHDLNDVSYDLYFSTALMMITCSRPVGKPTKAVGYIFMPSGNKFTSFVNKFTSPHYARSCHFCTFR